MNPTPRSGGSGFETPCPWAGVCALCGAGEAEGDHCPWMLQPEENRVVQGLLWSAVSSVRNKS